MNANELRVGNYILLEDKHIIKCDLIDIDLCKIDRKPIPLTEEILLKIGAKCLGFADEFNEIKQYDLGYGIIIDFYVKINEFDVYYCNNIIECYDDIEIKLHELQNLYLGLTRKELEINL